MNTLNKVFLISKHLICLNGELRKISICCMVEPLKRQSQQLSSALSSACDFKSHFCKQCGPRSDCSGSTLFAYMQNVSLNSLQEDAADDISR